MNERFARNALIFGDEGMSRLGKNRGIAHRKAVYSRGEPIRIVADESKGCHGPGSVSFVLLAVGLALAGEAVRNLEGVNGGKA